MSFVTTLASNLARVDDPRPLVSEVTVDGIRDVSRRDLADRVARARGALAASGVAPGDRVVLLAPNGADLVAAELAVLFEGAISVVLYPKQAVAELAAQIADADPTLVLVADAALRAALGDAGVVGVRPLADALAHAPRLAPPAPRKPADVVTLVYTSGTTGGSKGACVTSGNVDFMLPRTSGALAALRGRGPGQDRVFHYLPLPFMGSRIVLWTCLWRDNGILLGTDLDRLVDELAVAQPHYLLNVPLVLDRIRRGVDQAVRARGRVAAWLWDRTQAALANPRPSLADRAVIALAEPRLLAPIRARLGPNLEFLICGSAPLQPDTQAWFERLGIPVYQVYGLTETTAIVTMDRADTARPGTVGVPLDGVEARILDPGGRSELAVRGPNVFPGYWRRPEATAAALADGWLLTGDQASFDEAGRLVLAGRVKELLVPSTGHNVAPAPIEEALLARLPTAAQAVVVGHGRPHLAVLLFGAVDPAEAQRAVDDVNATLPGYKQLRGVHVEPAALTHEAGHLTANGKLRRAAIEAAFAAPVARLYA